MKDVLITKGFFPNDVKEAVQYGENLQALSVALNTVGVGSVKRIHEILSGVFKLLGLPDGIPYFLWNNDSSEFAEAEDNFHGVLFFFPG